ncbi:MAG: hypothetical protein K5912_02450 [Alphaproteobacteria bacterium]|nr:hypothetical protein [Alphaproteobacteria bacterium]
MKLFLSALCALSFVSGAVALPTPDNARENCRELEIAGTHVWSEKSSICLSINPCMNTREETNFSIDHCKLIFSDNRFFNADVAERLVAGYLKKVKKQEVKEAITTVWDADRVLGVKTTDGEYFGFMFRSGYETDERNSILDATCVVFGKKQVNPSTDVNGNKLVYCAEVKKQQICDEMAEFARNVAGVEIIGRLQQDENTCELMYAE